MNVRDLFPNPRIAASRVAELAPRLEELKKERRDVQAAASASAAEKAAASALAAAEARHEALGGEHGTVEAARRQRPATPPT